MKVLIINSSFLPLPAVKGGAVEFLIDEYLKYNSTLKKHDIVVYSVYDKKLEKIDNYKYNSVEFRYINKKSKFYIFLRTLLFIKRRIFRKKQVPIAYAFSVINDLKKRKELDSYDVVIFENQIESIMMYSKKISGYKVEHLHNDYLNLNTKEAFKVTNACDEFWGVSEFICNQINKVNPKCKTKVLYNGINVEKFSYIPSLTEKNIFYDKTGFKDTDYIILYVGRIMPEKGVLELLKSFNKVKSEKDNMKLLIVGNKKNNKKEINEYYEKMLSEKIKNDDSIYFYGNATYDELKIIYNMVNLQVIPTLCEEAFGLVLLEGMSANLPLIVTKSGGMSEIANDSVEVIDRNNILSELPDKLIKVYNKGKTINLNNNYKKILDRFTIQNYCKNFDKYILSCRDKENKNEKK